MSKFGLSQAQLSTLISILKKNPDISKAFIFGSRALNSHHEGSDIDIALDGPAITLNTLATLYSQFEESTLPFKIDLVDYTHLTNTALKTHIDTHGTLLFNRLNTLHPN